MKLIDLTGQRFGILTVIRRDENNKWNETTWLCQCDCGKEKKLTYGKLVLRKQQSCGCLRKPPNVTKHGLRNHKLYYLWSGMKQRCYNKNHCRYSDYGGRGIEVCKEWTNAKNGFTNFYNWAISNGYDESAGYRKCTLDRIDVNGNYEPNNCRWITQKEQNNNKRNNVILSYNGKTHNITEWCNILNLTQSAIRHRLERGWSVEKTLSTPLIKKS
jgi:hypothetical protein